MPRPPQSEAQKAATAHLVAVQRERAAQRAAAKAAAAEEIPVETPTQAGPYRDAISAGGGGYETDGAQRAPEETITVGRDALDDLIAEKVAEKVSAILAQREAAGAAIVPIKPEVPSKPFWAFLHADSPAFAALLPTELRSHTPDGYWRCRPDGVMRNRTRPRRGRYVTDDPEIAQHVLARIEAGDLPGVVVDNDANRLRLTEAEVTALSA